MSRHIAKGLVRGATAALLFALSGCGTNNIPFIEPTTGSVAYLNFKDLNDHELWAATYAEPTHCTHRYQFNVGKDGPLNVRLGFARIPADGLVTITVMNFPAYNLYCDHTVSFRPEAGRYYRAETGFPGGTCHFALRSSDSETFTNPRSEPFKIMGPRDHMPFDETGSFCSP